MIDLRYPEGNRYRSDDFSYTHEFRCPCCGCKSADRSWDPDKQVFIFHCACCGHDTQLTWKEVAVYRATGELNWDKSGNVIVPDGVTVPPLPADPNNSAYEDWNIMKEATAAPTEPEDTEDEAPNGDEETADPGTPEG